MNPKDFMPPELAAYYDEVMLTTAQVFATLLPIEIAAWLGSDFNIFVGFVFGILTWVLVHFTFPLESHENDIWE